MNIQEIRQKYPQYQDMTDSELASSLRQKYYPDMPESEFNASIGLQDTKESNGTDWGRMAAEMGGGIVGGALGSGAGPVGTLAGVGLGSEAGGQLLDLSRQYLGGQNIQGTLPERVINAATNVGANAAGQLVGGKLFDMAGAGINKLMSPVSNRIMGGPSHALMQGYEAAGVPPTAGLISGNRLIQGAEEALSKTPGSHGVMSNFRNDFTDKLSSYADEVARATGGFPTGEESASLTLMKGAKSAADRFRIRYQALEDTAENLIGRDTRVNPSNAASLLDDIESRYLKDTKALAYLEKPITYLRGIVRQGLDAEAPPDAIGDVSFGALRKARTHIGKSLEQPSISGYVGDEGAQFRRIYGALTEDIKAAADAAGPDAKKAWETANRYARTNLKNRVPALEDIAAKSDKAYKWLMQGSNDTGARLAIMRSNLKPDEWDEIVSTTIQRMGRATAGNQNVEGDIFSPATFLTNWNKLSKGAKSELFGAKRYAGLRDEMDNLLKISASVKDTNYVKNPSGTAGMNLFIDMITNPVKAATAIPVMGIPQYQLAKAFTNKKFIRWVANGAKIPPTDLNALKVHMARMPIVSGVSPDEKSQP